MQDPLSRIPRRCFEVIQEEMNNWVRNVLGAYNPANLMSFMESMGIDVSQMKSQIGAQPGLDPYKILGLEKSATDGEVKKRYRELLHKLHPDTGIEGTTFLLQMVIAAYETIKLERGWGT